MRFDFLWCTYGNGVVEYNVFNLRRLKPWSLSFCNEVTAGAVDLFTPRLRVRST